MNFNFKKIDELINSNARLAEILGRKVEVEEKKKKNPALIILAIVGCVAIVAAIAYAVYRFAGPKEFESFGDFDDDFDDDFEEEEEFTAD